MTPIWLLSLLGIIIVFMGVLALGMSAAFAGLARHETALQKAGLVKDETGTH